MTQPERSTLDSLPAAQRATAEKVLAAFNEWLGNGGQGHEKGTLEATISVANRLRGGGSTASGEHIAPSGGQVRTSRPGVVRTFIEFGVPGEASTEVGRTSRGAVGRVNILLAVLRQAGWDRLTGITKSLVATEMLRALCDGITAYHLRDSLNVPLGAAITPSRLVEMILERAAERPAAGGKAAQHLVGAKLAIRFDGIHKVGEDRMAAADSPTKRSGDFQLGNTAFHVTLAPGDAVLDKCEANINDGLRPVLLVPYARLDQARKNCEDRGLRDRVTVHSIGEYVGGNIDEIGKYQPSGTINALVRVIDEYNRRMVEIEAEPSLKVEVPESLRRLADER